MRPVTQVQAGGRSSLTIKAHNRRTLLLALLREQPISRVRLARTTGLSTTTVTNLVAELSAREARYALAFSDLKAVRVALDQDLSDFDAPLAGVREVAFFPPMTGG